MIIDFFKSIFRVKQFRIDVIGGFKSLAHDENFGRLLS